MNLVSPFFNFKKLLSIGFSFVLCDSLCYCSLEDSTGNTKTDLTKISPVQVIADNISVQTDTVEDKMVWIPGGTFEMGSLDPSFTDAQPVHKVTVDGFWMDEHEVTNAEFAAFVKETDYVTVAERPLNLADFPGGPAENIVPGSGVFTPTAAAVPSR